MTSRDHTANSHNRRKVSEPKVTDLNLVVRGEKSQTDAPIEVGVVSNRDSWVLNVSI